MAIEAVKKYFSQFGIYDAATTLNQFSRHLTGPGLSEGSVVGELIRVTDVIKRLSPLYEAEYEAGVDWEVIYSSVNGGLSFRNIHMIAYICILREFIVK